MTGDRLAGFEELVLLATLRLGEEAYGLEIRREIARRADRDVSYGAVYSALNRLEEKRFVTSRAGETPTRRGGRAKRFFKVTDRGVKALKAARKLRDELSRGVEELSSSLGPSLAEPSSSGDRLRTAPPSLEDPRQRRIHQNLLRLLGPGPASFFFDACLMMQDRAKFSTITHLVGHLLREIESAVRNIVEGAAARDQRVAWPADRKERHRNEIRTVLEYLEISEEDPLGAAWLTLAGRGEGALHGRAHRSSLMMPRPADRDFLDWWSTMQGILEQVLERLEARFLEYTTILDELLAKEVPGRRDIRILKNKVPNNLVALHYFFERLDKPGWLTPLEQADYFDVSALETEGGESLRWPQFAYLARIAGLAETQDQVFEIALRAASVKNGYICDSLADAAQTLPANLSKELAPYASGWLDQQSALAPRKLAAWAMHLARGGETDAALEVARVLFRLELGSEDASQDEHGGGSLHTKPQPRCGEWEYGKLLEESVPELVDAAGLPAVRVLCDLLDEMLRLSRKATEKKPEDLSHIWRPAVEEHRWAHADPRDALIDAVRSATTRLAEADPKAIPTLVRELDSREWWLFRRLALDLLTQFPGAAPTLVSDRLVNEDLFNELAVRHEYNRLASVGFRHLNFERQQELLGWIETGPSDLEEDAAAYEEFHGRAPSPEELDHRKHSWQRDRLATLGDELPGEWQQRLDGLVADLGDPDIDGFTVGPIRTWMGPVSPKDEQDLAAMPIAELTEFLSAWEPSGEWESPSKEGLGRILKDVVASEPNRFAADAHRFRGLDPTYVRCLFNGLREGVRNGAPVEWKIVLKLASWVVQQPREIPGRPEGGTRLDQDPDWGATRQAIAELLFEGFEDRPEAIPIEHRKVAWQVLRPLTDDPEPTPEYEAEYGGTNMDPGTLSINTTRGRAMHAVIRYALWVRRHRVAGGGSASRKTRGLDEAPEVRDVLEEHLDPRQDPSSAVRAVYGWLFPWLVLLDPTWAASRIGRIFGHDSHMPELGQAAWGAYLRFSRPYDDVLDVLASEYIRAVDSLAAQEGSTTGGRGDPVGAGSHLNDEAQRLAEHIMVYYWRGRSDLSDSGSLVSRFFTNASPTLRARALTFLGQALKDNDDVPPDVLERLKALWAERLTMARAGTSADFVDEIAAFGWWVASGRIDDAWTIRQLEAALAVAGKVDLDHAVAERLVEIAVARPLDAVNCLSSLVEPDGEPWRVVGIRGSARAILETALKSRDEAAKKAAEELINRLAARGYMEFADLLQ